MSFFGMGITDQSPLRYGTATVGKRTQGGGGDFAGQLLQAVEEKGKCEAFLNMPSGATENGQYPGKTHVIYIKTDDMLYSGGNGTGLSYYIKYAPNSTEDDPIVVAKGVDENGREFEQTIHINRINPCCATVVEMHALEAYLGVDRGESHHFRWIPVPWGCMTEEILWRCFESRYLT